MTTLRGGVRRLPRADPVRPRRGRPPDRQPVSAVPRGDEPGAHHPARRSPLRADDAAARDRLLAEGVPADDVLLTGNTVIDALLADRPPGLPASLRPRSPRSIPRSRLVLVTTHRRESFGAPLRVHLRGARAIWSSRFPDIEVVLPVHPNPEVKADGRGDPLRPAAGAPDRAGGLRRVRPPDGPGAPDPDRQRRRAGRGSLAGQAGAGAAGDRPSGPRAWTPERRWSSAPTVSGSCETASRAARPRPRRTQRMANAVNPYGDGQASERIVAALEQRYG